MISSISPVPSSLVAKFQNVNCCNSFGISYFTGYTLPRGHPIQSRPMLNATHQASPSPNHESHSASSNSSASRAAGRKRFATRVKFHSAHSINLTRARRTTRTVPTPRLICRRRVLTSENASLPRDTAACPRRTWVSRTS